jgi:hypothetical protein
MRLLWIVPVLLVALICGCPTSGTRRQPATPPDTPQTVPANVPSEQPPETVPALTFTVTDPAGAVVLGVDSDLTVEGKQGTLGKLKLDGKVVKIDDPSGTKIGSVKVENQELIVDDAQGKKLFRMAPKDGGYRVKDAQSTTLLKIKPDDNGFKLGDDAGKKLGKGKKKGADTIISDANGEELYRVKGAIRPNVAGVLIVPEITPIQKAALIFAASL